MTSNDDSINNNDINCLCDLKNQVSAMAMHTK